MTPSARSIKKMEAEGWLIGVVERFNSFSGTRHDLFGFIDLLAVREGEVMGIQATSGSNTAARVKKIANHQNWPKVKSSPVRVVVHGWRKNAKGRWVCREEEITNG